MGFDLGSLVAPVLGGLFGASSSGSSQQTQTKDPWAAAQPWMTSNLGLGQNLQAQYAANPFSQAQQSAYTNAANGNAATRNMANAIIPQLSNIPAFDRTNPLNKPAPLDLSGGLQSGNSAGSVGFSNPTVQANVPAPLQQAYQQYIQTQGKSGGGGGNLGLSDSGYGGAAMDFQKYMNTPDGLAAAYALGKVQNMFMGTQDGSQVPVSDATPAAPQGFGYVSDSPHSFGGGDGTGPGGSSGSASAGSNTSGTGVGEGRAGASGFYKGGLVKKSNLSGPDPRGPDQGRANLQSGEMVIKKSSVQKYGKGLLNDINSGTYQKGG